MIDVIQTCRTGALNAPTSLSACLDAEFRFLAPAVLGGCTCALVDADRIRSTDAEWLRRNAVREQTFAKHVLCYRAVIIATHRACNHFLALASWLALDAVCCLRAWLQTCLVRSCGSCRLRLPSYSRSDDAPELRCTPTTCQPRAGGVVKRLVPGLNAPDPRPSLCGQAATT